MVSLDEVRQRKLIRKSSAHGLLNAYELTDKDSAAWKGAVLMREGRANGVHGRRVVWCTLRLWRTVT